MWLNKLKLLLTQVTYTVLQKFDAFYIQAGLVGNGPNVLGA